MNKEKIPEVKEKGIEITEVLAFLKSKGFVFEGEKKGYMECLLSLCRTPTQTERARKEGYHGKAIL